MGDKTTVRGEKFRSYTVEGDGDTLILTAGSSITVSDESFGIEAEGAHSHIFVNGSIVVTQGDADIGVSILGGGSSLTIAKSGDISADTGVDIHASSVIFNNAGTIRGLGGQGLLISDNFGSSVNSHLTNSGRISGDIAVLIDSQGGWFMNQSKGKLIGDQHGFFLYGDTTLINHGLIQSESDSAVEARNASEIVIRNDGRIVGNVFLSDGGDTIDTRGGKITGGIFSGKGFDTLITDDAHVKLTETIGQGLDTVKSTVSYILNQDIEQLYLLGKKNINGTGNDDANNFLYGNSGNNILDGRNGNNEMYGLGGNDTLKGGTGQDIFAFDRNYDHDTMVNYVDEQDFIAMQKFGFDDFSRVEAHMKQHGDDVWINMGKGDLLIIKDTDAGVLETTDFLFNY